MMNSPMSSPSDGLFSDKIGGFGYGITVSIGILILIITITLTSYFCTRSGTGTGTGTSNSQPHSSYSSSSTHPEPSDHPPHQHSIQIIHGIDEATLLRYPKLLYSELKRLKYYDSCSGCSICLAEYKGRDVLRLLPDCAHVFHIECVDPWLRMHSTCPLCRSSPFPTPLSTPLAEVAPLAARPVM